MNGHKKRNVWLCAFVTAVSMSACGQVKEESAASRQESGIQTSEGTDSEIKRESFADQQESGIESEDSGANVDESENAGESTVNQQESGGQAAANPDPKESTVDQQESSGQAAANPDPKESTVDQQENSVQAVENADSEGTAEELLDLFLNGSISAADPEDSTAAFNITDLGPYSIGEKIDLDNDGENELVMSGPYGGIYLDARNGRVYEFAAGDGDARILSYTYYNGAVWIMYSDSIHAGYESYHMERFEGADNLTAEMDFGEESADQNDSESEMKYTLNRDVISYDEYAQLCSKIFAAQVETG